jgi:hypothetical protein
VRAVANRRSVLGKCKWCPNTAWLLFLVVSLVLVALVALSVYLSKRKLNLAVLGIGMVRVARAAAAAAAPPSPQLLAAQSKFVRGAPSCRVRCVLRCLFPVRISCKWCPCLRRSTSHGPLY